MTLKRPLSYCCRATMFAIFKAGPCGPNTLIEGIYCKSCRLRTPVNINEQINWNFDNSTMIIATKNRRFEEFKGWVFDGIQVHHVRNKFLPLVIRNLSKQGYKVATMELYHFKGKNA